MLRPVHEALLLGVFLPSLLYSAMICFWTYVYESRPFLVYALTTFFLVFCIFLRSFKAEGFIRKEMLLEQPEGGPSLAPFQSVMRNRVWSFWCLISVFIGAWGGRVNFQTNRLPYVQTKEGGTYYNIAPFDKTEDKTDAGIIHFNSMLTTMDVNVFRAYRHKGVNYCVAPLTSPKQPGGSEHLLARYFAVGTDCCSVDFAPCLQTNSDNSLTAANVNEPTVAKAGIVLQKPDFFTMAGDSTASTVPTATTPLSYAYSKQPEISSFTAELSLLLDGQSAAQTVFFQSAAKSCASFFGLQIAEKPIFVFYTSDAQKFQKTRDGMVFGMCVLGIGIGLPVIFLGGVVITNVLSRRARSTSG
ncbi:unnamed protein product [Amoebophrya sp. A120]|nr:unnamed protein product [Amoebophrya sp. A120]|eukprot:GSA120T00008175001.1